MTDKVRRGNIAGSFHGADMVEDDLQGTHALVPRKVWDWIVMVLQDVEDYSTNNDDCDFGDLNQIRACARQALAKIGGE